MIESENYVQSIMYIHTYIRTTYGLICAGTLECILHMSRKDKAVDVLIVAHVHYVWVLMLSI